VIVVDNPYNQSKPKRQRRALQQPSATGRKAFGWAESFTWFPAR
jgi:hypothetical protein